MHSLFIMSSERSGSNLLRMMLGAHPQLAAPPPPHMWRHLTKALPRYSPLSDEQNFRSLAEDAVAMTQRSYAHLKWKHEFSVADVLDRTTETTLSSIISALYQAYAEAEEANGWVCKENNLFNHAHQIRECLPDAKFIYLCRDGRDVACSMQDMPTHGQHAFALAKEWKEQQYDCIRVTQELIPSEDSHLLRYEDLIENPASAVRDVCAFSGIDFKERMLYFHETEEAVQQAEKSQVWENLSRPVMSSNKGKFYSELSAHEVRIFESVAGDLLQLLGYPLTTSPSEQRLPLWKKAYYQGRNFLESLLKRQEISDWDGREERTSMLDHIHNHPHRSEDSTLAPSLTYDQKDPSSKTD